jgi:hypothetical protein
VFMVKIWVTVSGQDYPVALKLATAYLAAHERDTRFIHDAK